MHQFGNDSENKCCKIDTTQTRYQMKKAMRIPNDPVPLKHKCTIVSKVRGYKQQDKLKKIFNENQFVTEEFVMGLLDKCDMNCYYCKEKTLLEYDIVREMKQWTLDRMDNTRGHDTDNVVISCLSCNLKRRNIRKDSFLMTSQLSLVKLSNV